LYQTGDPTKWAGFSTFLKRVRQSRKAPMAFRMFGSRARIGRVTCACRLASNASFFAPMHSAGLSGLRGFRRGPVNLVRPSHSDIGPNAPRRPLGKPCGVRCGEWMATPRPTSSMTRSAFAVATPTKCEIRVGLARSKPVPGPPTGFHRRTSWPSPPEAPNLID